MAESRPDGAPESGGGASRPGALVGWLAAIALLGGLVTGVAGLIAGAVLLMDNRATERVAGGLALIGATVSFGLLSNALLRR
jgi:hypothetical protein